jgi:hypothetical protein
LALAARERVLLIAARAVQSALSHGFLCRGRLSSYDSPCFTV